MENSVTLDLKAYTDLIRENEQLKERLKIFLRRDLEDDMDGYYEGHHQTLSKLYCIKDKARLKGIAEEKDDVKALESAGLHVYEIKRLAENYKGFYSVEYAYAYLADAVREAAYGRLKKLEAKEGGEQ